MPTATTKQPRTAKRPQLDPRVVERHGPIPDDELPAAMAASTLDTTQLHTKEDLMRFVKYRRSIVDKTQGQVAAAIGTKSAEYIGLMEAEKRLLAGDRWPAMARILEVNAKDLSKLYLRIVMPAMYAALFGDEALTAMSADDDTHMKFTQLPEAALDFLRRVYTLPPQKRRLLEDTLAMLATK